MQYCQSHNLNLLVSQNPNQVVFSFIEIPRRTGRPFHIQNLQFLCRPILSIQNRWYLNSLCHTAINIRNLTLAMKCNIHTSLSNKTNVKVGRFAYAYHDIDRNDPMYFVKVFSPLALLAFLATIVLIILVFANVL